MKHKLYISGIISLILIIVMFGMFFSTTPERIGPTGVTFMFFLIYALSFALIDFFWRLFHQLGWANYHHSMIMISLLAGVPPVILALQSLGQLQLRDIVIVFFFASVVILYWSRKY